MHKSIVLLTVITVGRCFKSWTKFAPATFHRQKLQQVQAHAEHSTNHFWRHTKTDTLAQGEKLLFGLVQCFLDLLCDALALSCRGGLPHPKFFFGMNELTSF
uniref:Secreted protein n=1 Tax=Trieres chinensis TaxID=1514140 RepID=A0A7S2AAR4_TRICV